jgi:hypothetical protein
MCAVLLPPGGYPIAVEKYIIEGNGMCNFKKVEFLDVIRGSVKGNLQALED